MSDTENTSGNTTLSDFDEEWVPLKPDDYVFWTPNDEHVVVYPGGGACCGAIVRNRDGQYMKRTRPMTILNPLEIITLRDEGKYKRGADFTPSKRTA